MSDHHDADLDRRLGVREPPWAGIGYAGLLANEGVNVCVLFGAYRLLSGVRRVGVDLQRGEGCQGLRADRGPPVGSRPAR